ncbi:MAG: Crp/Fnr family transcriptional regulator [Saprospiraceae bacterium]|nr:Crp/Fnr family transcriptional regulator [Saprospiraceae bacterium]
MDYSILVEVFKDAGFSPEELSLLAPLLKEVNLKKGDTLLSEGDTVLHTHLVYSGCLRTYFLDDAGKEHTLQFAIKDWWISDYTAFFTGDKALTNIECIQEATVYKLSRKNMKQLYIDLPGFETFFRKKLERRFMTLQKRILGNLAQPAKDRYLSFIENYPNIQQNVKNYHIASFLGITTESLSRIRKELAR